MLRRRSFWLTLAITGLFLWLFLRGTNFGEVGRELAQANYIFLAPAVLMYFVGIWFRALRWRLLLQPIGSTSANRLFPVMVIAYMINDIIPGRVGIVARAYMGGEKANVNKVAIVTAARITDCIIRRMLKERGFSFLTGEIGVSISSSSGRSGLVWFSMVRILRIE